MLEPEGRFALKVHRYDPEGLKETRNALNATALQRHILNILHANEIGVDHVWGEDQDEWDGDEAL